MRIITIIAVIGFVSGCETSSPSQYSDPIVNSGVSNEGNNTNASGYVPWWVENKVPNSAGVIVE